MSHLRPMKKPKRLRYNPVSLKIRRRIKPIRLNFRPSKKPIRAREPISQKQRIFAKALKTMFTSMNIDINPKYVGDQISRVGFVYLCISLDESHIKGKSHVGLTTKLAKMLPLMKCDMFCKGHHLFAL